MRMNILTTELEAIADDDSFPYLSGELIERFRNNDSVTYLALAREIPTFI